MSDNMAQIGRLVCSLQGRDSGRYYLVVGIVNKSRVLLADGEIRKLDNPKTKNIKHLKFYDQIAGEVYNKAVLGVRFTNADVRKDLKSLIKQV